MPAGARAPLSDCGTPRRTPAAVPGPSRAYPYTADSCTDYSTFGRKVAVVAVVVVVASIYYILMMMGLVAAASSSSALSREKNGRRKKQE